VNSGFICEWRTAEPRIGTIKQCSPYEDRFWFEWDDCDKAVQDQLARDINISCTCPGPPGCIAVIFRNDGTGQALDVRLAAGQVDVAASAEAGH
jgi:hypothetical protein